MTEVTNTDLLVKIAELKGEVEGLSKTTALQMAGFAESLRTSQDDRRVMALRLDQLESWKDKLTGIWLGLPGLATLLSILALLKANGVHF